MRLVVALLAVSRSAGLRFEQIISYPYISQSMNTAARRRSSRSLPQIEQIVRK